MIQGTSDFLNGVAYSGNGRLILGRNWIPSLRDGKGDPFSPVINVVGHGYTCCFILSLQEEIGHYLLKLYDNSLPLSNTCTSSAKT
jgi:hypothetical protein